MGACHSFILGILLLFTDLLYFAVYLADAKSVMRRPFLMKGPPGGVYRRCSIVNTSPEYCHAADLRNPYSFQ